MSDFQWPSVVSTDTTDMLQQAISRQMQVREVLEPRLRLAPEESTAFLLNIFPTQRAGVDTCIHLEQIMLQCSVEVAEIENFLNMITLWRKRISSNPSVLLEHREAFIEIISQCDELESMERVTEQTRNAVKLLSTGIGRGVCERLGRVMCSLILNVEFSLPDELPEIDVDTWENIALEQGVCFAFDRIFHKFMVARSKTCNVYHNACAALRACFERLRNGDTFNQQDADIVETMHINTLNRIFAAVNVAAGELSTDAALLLDNYVCAMRGGLGVDEYVAQCQAVYSPFTLEYMNEHANHPFDTDWIDTVLDKFTSALKTNVKLSIQGPSDRPSDRLMGMVMAAMTTLAVGGFHFVNAKTKKIVDTVASALLIGAVITNAVMPGIVSDLKDEYVAGVVKVHNATLDVNVSELFEEVDFKYIMQEITFSIGSSETFTPVLAVSALRLIGAAVVPSYARILIGSSVLSNLPDVDAYVESASAYYEHSNYMWLLPSTILLTPFVVHRLNLKQFDMYISRIRQYEISPRTLTSMSTKLALLLMWQYNINISATLYDYITRFSNWEFQHAIPLVALILYEFQAAAKNQLIGAYRSGLPQNLITSVRSVPTTYTKSVARWAVAASMFVVSTEFILRYSWDIRRTLPNIAVMYYVLAAVENPTDRMLVSMQPTSAGDLPMIARNLNDNLYMFYILSMLRPGCFLIWLFSMEIIPTMRQLSFLGRRFVSTGNASIEPFGAEWMQFAWNEYGQPDVYRAYIQKLLNAKQKSVSTDTQVVAVNDATKASNVSASFKDDAMRMLSILTQIITTAFSLRVLQVHFTDQSPVDEVFTADSWDWIENNLLSEKLEVDAVDFIWYLMHCAQQVCRHNNYFTETNFKKLLQAVRVFDTENIKISDRIRHMLQLVQNDTKTYTWERYSDQVNDALAKCMYVVELLKTDPNNDLQSKPVWKEVLQHTKCLATNWIPHSKISNTNVRYGTVSESGNALRLTFCIPSDDFAQLKDLGEIPRAHTFYTDTMPFCFHVCRMKRAVSTLIPPKDDSKVHVKWMNDVISYYHMHMSELYFRVICRVAHLQHFSTNANLQFDAIAQKWQAFVQRKMQANSRELFPVVNNDYLEFAVDLPLTMLLSDDWTVMATQSTDVYSSSPFPSDLDKALTQAMENSNKRTSAENQQKVQNISIEATSIISSLSQKGDESQPIYFYIV